MKPVANFAICVILCCSKLVASVPFPEDLARYLAAAYGNSALTGLQQQLQPQQIAFNPSQDQQNNIQNQFKPSQNYPPLQNGDVSSGVLLGPIQNQNPGSVQKNFLGQSQVPIFQQQRLPQQSLNIPLQQQNYQEVNEPFINGISEIKNPYDGSGGAASQAYVQPNNIIRSIQEIQRNPGLYTQKNIGNNILQNDQKINRQESQINIPIVNAPSIQQRTIEQPLLNANIRKLTVPQLTQDSRIQNVISGTKFKKRFLVIHPDGTIDHVDSLESVIKQNPNYVLLNAARITEPKHTKEQHSPTVQENNIQSHVHTNPQIHQQQFRVTEVTAKKEDPVKGSKLESNINKPVYSNNKAHKLNNKVPDIKNVLLNKNVQGVQNKPIIEKIYKSPVTEDTKHLKNLSQQNDTKKPSHPIDVKKNSAAISSVSSSDKIPNQNISNSKIIKNEKVKTTPKVTKTWVSSKEITPSKQVEIQKRIPHTNDVKTTVNVTSSDSEPQSKKKQHKERHITNPKYDVDIENKAKNLKHRKNDIIKPNISTVDSTKVNKSLNIVPISSSKNNSTNPNINIKSTKLSQNHENSNNNADKPHKGKKCVNESKTTSTDNSSINKTSTKEDKSISDHKENNTKKNAINEKGGSKNSLTKKNNNVKNTQPLSKSENTESRDEGKQKMLEIIKTLSQSEYKDKVMVLQIVMPPIVDREVHSTVYPNGTIVDEITELIWDEEDEGAAPVEVKTINVRHINDEE